MKSVSGNSPWPGKQRKCLLQLITSMSSHGASASWTRTILSAGIERIALRSVLREKMWKLSSVNPIAGWSARRTTSQESR